VNARDEILARVTRSLADRPRPAAVPRDYRRGGDPGVDPVALFAERAADYRATVQRVPAAGLPEAIASVLAERGARRVAVPDAVVAGWLTGAAVESLTDDPPLSTAQLDAADGVVTGCALAVADTGTIVLDAGVAQGRRALTLLPDFHLCVVRTDQVVASVPEAVARLDARRPLTWISGPSATSDIELNRVEGVHGPRTLHILLVTS
jgi:L-lactate dehydrogenase complex protein LldG